MKQSRRASLLESCANTASGFGLSLGCQFGFLVWWKGLPMTFHDNLQFAIFMTGVSIARSYGWRRLMERLQVRLPPLSPFVIAVLAECRRQREVEGWTLTHDDEHEQGDLARAGASYLLGAAYPGAYEANRPPHFWPWQREWWKPTAIRRDLVKGTALAIAEGEKFDRSKKDNRRPQRHFGPPSVASRA